MFNINNYNDEKFLMEFLCLFNENDKNKKGKSKDFWKQKGFKGEFIYYVRNIIVHELEDRGLLKKIDETIGYSIILEFFKEFNKEVLEDIKIKCILFISKYYEKYFVSRKYEKIDKNKYIYFRKSTKISGIYSNIFIYDNISSKEGFMSIGVHSYDYYSSENFNINFKNLYVRSEPTGYIMINDYSLHKDIPIMLEVNYKDKFYRFTIPKVDVYNEIKSELNISNGIIDVKCDEDEFQKNINIIYKEESNTVREILKCIEQNLKNMQQDLEDINIV